jgi:ribosomal-protein-alanine N-acetyltransferase
VGIDRRDSRGPLTLRLSSSNSFGLLRPAARPCDDLFSVATPGERGSEEAQAAFHFKPLSQANAAAIALWHYPEPFSFYDWAEDPDDLAELLDPALRGDAYFAVEDGADDLIGFFSFKRRDARTLQIGLGLHPERTGQGLGGAFLRAGLDYGRSRFEPAQFVLSVATFNRRAIAVYERAGFIAVRVFMHSTNGGEWEFVEMRRSA